MSFSNRVLIIYTLLAIILGTIVLVRFSYIILNHDGTGNITNARKSQIVRGSIFDRNGKLLASQIKRRSLDAWLPNIRNYRGSAEIIANILKIDTQKLYERLYRSKRNYMWIKRFLSDREADELEEQIAHGKLPGFKLREEYKRYYPLGELASHLIGFTNIDGVGLDGVELSMESWLNPKNITATTNRYQNLQYGDNIYLSIDIDTQYIIDKIARKTMIATKGDYLVAMLMDARTGALLAFVSLPEYDLNLFNRYSSEILRNQAISTTYEPGSVFKIYTMAAMLDENVIDVDDILDITTVYNPSLFERNKIPPIRDITPHGPLSATEVLIYSSNVGMASAAEGISSQALYQKLRLFGFGKTTGIQLPGESHGILRKPSRWSLRSKPTIVFGQELGVSAIQMVRAATALTNGGMLLAPIIINRIQESNGNIRVQNSRQPEYEVISPITAQNMLLMMEQVVASDLGTMRGSRIDGLRISGKSGTAEVFNLKAGKYHPEQVNSSAIAIFPTDDPQFIIYFNIFNPKTAVRYGGRLISPLVPEAIRELTTHYNLPLKGNRIAYFNEDIQTLIEKQLDKPSTNRELSESLSQVPDVHGMPKRQLLPLLRIPGLLVEIIGTGHVIRQSLAPGTPIPQIAQSALNSSDENLGDNTLQKNKPQNTAAPLPLKIWLQ